MSGKGQAIIVSTKVVQGDVLWDLVLDVGVRELMDSGSEPNMWHGFIFSWSG